MMLTCMVPVYAIDTSYLEYSTISKFTPEDTMMMQKAYQKALEVAKDGIVVRWHNKKTGAYGYFIPSHSSTINGITCRQLRAFNSANGVVTPMTYFYRLCNVHGAWKVVSWRISS